MTEFSVVAKNLQMILEVFSKICLTLFTCAMLYMIYNSLKVMGGSKSGSGLGSLLGEDASFEVHQFLYEKILTFDVPQILNVQIARLARMMK